MRERPIPFSGEMVRAILEGRKAQTRRVVKPKLQEAIRFYDCDDAKDANVFYAEIAHSGPGWYVECGEYPEEGAEFLGQCPYGQPGDRLWVRETWADTNGENGPMVSYRAGGDRFLLDESYPVDYSLYPGCDFTMWCGDLRRGADGHAWRPSIHMFRWASRITLEIVNVRVERLKDITPFDAQEEGMNVVPDRARWEFRGLWDALYAKAGHGWDANPFVWVIDFRRMAQ